MTIRNVKHGFVVATAKRANKDTFALEPVPGDTDGKAVTGLASTNTFTSNAHGLKAGDRGMLSGLVGGAGLSPGTIYYVIATGLTANAFQLSTTSGGAAVDFTSDLTAGTLSKLTIGSRRFISSGDPVPFGWAVAAADQDDATTVNVKP